MRRLDTEVGRGGRVSELGAGGLERRREMAGGDLRRMQVLVVVDGGLLDATENGRRRPHRLEGGLSGGGDQWQREGQGGKGVAPGPAGMAAGAAHQGRNPARFRQAKPFAIDRSSTLTSRDWQMRLWMSSKGLTAEDIPEQGLDTSGDAKRAGGRQGGSRQWKCGR